MKIHLGGAAVVAVKKRDIKAGKIINVRTALETRDVQNVYQRIRSHVDEFR